MKHHQHPALRTSIINDIVWQTSLVHLSLQNVEASVDGVLGGYGHVSSADITESEAFLKETYGARLVETGDQPLRALGQSHSQHHVCNT